jgi:DNA-binding NarL/FixJ family response regulator
LEFLGESLQKRIEKRTATNIDRGGLTRKQHEIVQLIALGMSNQENGKELVLSVRTVDMMLAMFFSGSIAVPVQKQYGLLGIWDLCINLFT